MLRSLPRLNFRVLSTFLIVSMPGLALALVVVLALGQAQLRASYGRHLTEVADYAAATADAYIFRRIVDTAILARAGEVRAASAASREPLDAARVAEIDGEWRKRAAPPPAFMAMLESPASRFLADVTKIDPVFREILVTDLEGRLVAASGAVSDYYQADEDWWKEAYADGVAGHVSVGDVQWDSSARLWAIDIAVPVPEPASDRLAGILKVVADIRELGVVVDGLRLGDTGDASLVRSDGSIVFSRRRIDPDARFFATDLLRERYAAGGKGLVSGVTFSARGPEDRDYLVAVAPSQLAASYPRLAWLVAVWQDEAELFAPIREQVWVIVAVLALVAVVVLALALWFSMRLAAPPLDESMDMHLVEHAKLPRIEDTA